MTYIFPRHHLHHNRLWPITSFAAFPVLPNRKDPHIMIVFLFDLDYHRLYFRMPRLDAENYLTPFFLLCFALLGLKYKVSSIFS